MITGLIKPVAMDNLLCDESWLSDPSALEPLSNFRLNVHDDHMEMSPAMDASTIDEAISIDLEKESCFSYHGHKFIESLVSKKLTDARFQTVQWLIQVYSYLFYNPLGFLYFSGKFSSHLLRIYTRYLGQNPLNIVDT